MKPSAPRHYFSTRFAVGAVAWALVFSSCGKSGNTAGDSSSSAISPGISTTASPSASLPGNSSLEAQLNNLVDRVQVKIDAGKDTAQDYAGEIKEFDALLAAHQGEKTDLVAKVAYMRDLLYVKFTKDPDMLLAMFGQFLKDYPSSPFNQTVVEQILPDLKKFSDAAAIRRTLIVGAQFPDFSEKDLDGQPLSVSQYQGKIVLVEFWATWCPICMAEMPDVVAAYNQYHAQGFEIIGISLDKEEDKAKLPAFLKANHMPWRQFCDGKYWDSELALKYGVNETPTAYLLDRTGKIASVFTGENMTEPAFTTALKAALASK